MRFEKKYTISGVLHFESNRSGDWAIAVWGWLQTTVGKK